MDTQTSMDAFGIANEDSGLSKWNEHIAASSSAVLFMNAVQNGILSSFSPTSNREMGRVSLSNGTVMRMREVRRPERGAGCVYVRAVVVEAVGRWQQPQEILLQDCLL